MAKPDDSLNSGDELTAKRDAPDARRGTAQKKAKAAPQTPAAQNNAQEHALYRALAPCRVGSYREPGDVFGWPRFASCPSYLEEAEEHAPAAATVKPASQPPGPVPADLFMEQ